MNKTDTYFWPNPAPCATASCDSGPMSAFAVNFSAVRSRLGKSQKEVAARLGVSPSLVSKWESGERMPDATQRWELGRFFGVSQSFLEADRPAVNFQPRSQVARNGEEKSEFGVALTEAAQQIHFLHEVWERAGDVPRRLSLELHWSDPMLPHLAGTVRQFLRLNARVTYDELREALAEQEVLTFEWALPPKMSGLSCQRDFSVIIVNSALPERVKLFTLCHELAHLLFHLRGEEETTVSVMASRNDPHEKEANRFAAEFLMPEAEVTALIAQSGTRLKTQTGFQAAVERFGVSNEAMFYRLVQRGVLSYPQKDDFFTSAKRPAAASPTAGPRVSHLEKNLPRPLLSRVVELVKAERASMGKAAEWTFAARDAVESHLHQLSEDMVELGLGETEGMEG